MKIGVVHFGCASAGATEIVRTLVEEASSQGDKVYGIEWNASAKKYNKLNLTEIHFIHLALIGID